MEIVIVDDGSQDDTRSVVESLGAGIRYIYQENRGLSAALLVKYFEQHGTHWQLKPVIRDMVDFQEINLAQPWPALPRMDLVLIRNVMIYFDEATKTKLVDRFADILCPGGFLYIGHSETLFKITARFEPAGQTLYRKVS